MTSNDPADLSAILQGSRQAIARAVTLIENERPGAAELAARLAAHRGRAQVIGITGAPGAGKSTLINALLAEFVRRGRRVAVVAVDPSSPLSGGSLLGDRIRMGDEHDAGDRVFIRSVSARGHLGGLSRTTGRILDVFDAAGFDPILVETVGTGQSEVEIARLADTRIVVCPPGLGDEVQALKAGILEIADILVVSKADHPDAVRTVIDLQHMPGRGTDPTGWTVPVLSTVATRGEGIAELVDRISDHARHAGTGHRANRDEGAAAARATDDELFGTIRSWRAAGRGVALATVLRTWGSSPRPAGSHLAVEADGAFIGSVSGGCVEGAVISEGLAAIADGKPRTLEFGVSDEQAWDVGLACGGRIQVFVERFEKADLLERLLRLRHARQPVAVVTRMTDGLQSLVEADDTVGELELAPAALAEARERLRTDRSGLLEYAEGLFVRCHVASPRLVLVGAVHIAQALAPMAAVAGYEVFVVDPRRAFATPVRLPDVHLSTRWPDEALAGIGLDARTAVVTLAHDPKIDDPALVAALNSPAFYIGALGSKRTHAQRIERLTQAGLGDAVHRIHAPVGLDLGGRSPAEIAISILAQLIQARYRT